MKKYYTQLTMKTNQINKLKLLITGAFVVFAQFVFAQSSTYEKMLINDDETSRYDVEGSFINSSGSIVVYGYQSKNNYDPFYLELDPATGDTLKWVDATGTLFPERMQSMVELPTGGYIGVGYTTRSNQNYPWIIKFDTNGDTVFTKSFHNYSNTFASCTSLLRGDFKDVIVNSSGDLIVTGQNDGCGNYMTLIAQLDTVDGSIDWVNGERNFNVAGGIVVESYRGRAIFQDGTNYVVAGDGYGGSSNKGTIIKFDSTGDTVWTSYASADQLNDIIKASDGNYYATGTSNPFSISNNAVLVKLSAAGVVSQTTNISPTGTDWSYGYSIAEGPNTNELLIGGVTQLSSASSDQALHSVSTSGVINYSKYYGFNDWVDRAYVLTSGTDIYLTGNENWGWDAKENYGAYLASNNPPHQLRPTLSKHNSDGEISGMHPNNNRNQIGNAFCQNVDFYRSPGYTNFAYSSSDIPSSSINFNSSNGYLNVNAGGTITISQDDKNGDNRSVTVTIEDNPQPTIAGYDQFFNITTSACAGDSLLVVAGGAAGSTFEWFVQGNGTAFSTNDTVYIKATTSIELKETTGIGCTGTAYQTITIATEQVNITSSDYPQKFNTSLGSGTDTNTRQPSSFKWAFNQDIEAWIAPIGGYKQQNAQQYLIKASELSALGLTSGSNISKIGFDFLDSYTSQVRELQIRIKETSANTVSSWNSFSSTSTSYDDYWHNSSISVGTNYYSLNDSYEWDGTSNIIIQFSYVNDNWTSSSVNPRIRMSDVGYDATLIGYGTQTSGLGQSNPPAYKKSQYRPNFYFEAAKGPLQDTIVGCSSSLSLNVENSGYQYLQWSTASSSTPISVSSAGSYTVQMLDANFCASIDTVEVLFSTPSVAASASLIKGCDGDVSTITASGTFDSYIWNNGSTGNSITATETGSYVVTAFDEYSCTAKDTINVEFVEKPILYVLDEPAFSGGSLTGTYASAGEYLGSYNGSEYYVVESSQSWSTANAAAQVLGGHLAILNDSSENAALTSMISGTAYSDLWMGIEWNGSKWMDVKGNDVDYSNWWGSTSQTAQHSLPYHNKGVFNWGNWYNYSGDGYSFYFLIEFPESGRALVASETFCDSVQIWTDQSFDSFLWSTGETDSIITVDATTASAITLTGTVNKSDGTTCALTSDGTSITINTTPTISITNNSGTVDYDGTNSISLTAGSSSSTTGYLWSNGLTTAAISVTAEGTYQVVGTDVGCSDSTVIKIFEPIYVAKTGNNSTGDGSFSSPYLTITYAIDQALSGSKIYVLPGTYNETINVTKNILIASDYSRLGNASALGTTIINGQSQRRLINYSNAIETLDSSISQIIGFTFQSGFEEQDAGAAIKADYAFTGSTLIKNSIIENTSRKCCSDGIVLYQNGSGHLVMDSVHIKDIGQSNDGDQRVSFRMDNGKLVIRNSILENFRQDNSLFNLRSSAELEIENTRITDIEERYSENGVIAYLHNSSKAIFNHVTIDNIDLSNSNYLFRFASGSSSEIYLINSTVDEVQQRLVRDQTSGNSILYVRNSVIGNAGSSLHATMSVLTPQLNTNGTLQSTSPAIGYGAASIIVNGRTFSSPIKDLRGFDRPIPLGTNPDAGAFEDSLSIGNLDIVLTQCAYLLEASILNSTNNTYSWKLNGTVVSTDLSYLATALGTYTFEVVSIDRNQTITEDIVLSDPLRYDLVYANNNCTSLSGNSGEVYWGGATGGDRNVADFWEYQSGINNENGTQYDGIWDIDENTWYNTRSSMPGGKYYVYVVDNSGCKVGDTINIVDQDQDTYYVSTSGSNSNTGTSKTDAFASIATAVDFACTNDTIILLDGTYYEDSLTVKKNLVMGSEFILDADTNHIAATIIDGDDNGWIMSWESGNNSWSDTTNNQIVGLTIQNGNSTNSIYAGGVRVHGSRVLLIDHVVFKDNQNNQNQGGALWTEYSTYIALKDVVFDGNSSINSGSGWYSSYSRSYGRNLVFKNHTGNNDVLHVSGAREFDVADVKVLNNATSERIMQLNMYDLQSDAVLSNWEVRNNTAQNRLVYIDDGSRDGKKSYYNNWLVVDNTATQDHPGINFGNSSGKHVFNNLTVWNNITSSGNAANQSNAQIWHEYSNQSTEIIITNSIIGSTNGYALTSQDWNSNTTISVDYSFIEGGASKTDGGTNTTISLGSSNVLSSSPYFTDAANDDYSLSNVSTLLGAGASTATVGGVSITAPTTDLYGNPRPNPSGTNPDIGAIESLESAPQVGIAAVTTDNGFCETASGSITANLLNYTATATYSWSSSTYPTWTWNATQSATGLSSGDYKVVAIDATSGAKIDSTEITIATLPSISITNTSTDVTCFGDDDGELTFEIYGGNPLGGSQYTYSVDYMESMAQATGVVLDGNYFDTDNNGSTRTNKYDADNWNGNPIYQGKYYVSVSDQDGCTFTDTLEIGFDHALPEVSITTLASDGTVGLTSMCEGIGNVINLTANVTGGGGTNTF